MKKLITTLVITLSLIGLVTDESHAGFLGMGASADNSAFKHEFTGTWGGSLAPFENYCGSTISFDSSNPSCGVAKTECAEILKGCVYQYCKSKDRGDRYKCDVSEWQTCSGLVASYGRGDYKGPNEANWEACFNPAGDGLFVDDPMDEGSDVETGHVSDPVDDPITPPLQAARWMIPRMVPAPEVVPPIPFRNWPMPSTTWTRKSKSKMLGIS